MYHPLEAWKDQDLRRAGLRWMRTSVPGGAKGVASKEKDPSIASKVESNRVVALVSETTPICDGERLGRLASPAAK
jgi:hypothetical protein